jgi:hypothetical protein
MVRLSDQCGGGLEDLHRNPAIVRGDKKGNPLPGGVTGPPCSLGGGYKYGDLTLQVVGMKKRLGRSTSLTEIDRLIFLLR